MTFQQVLAAALNDIAERGYRSPEQVMEWTRKLDASARASMIPEAQLKLEIDRYLLAAYDKLVHGGRVLEYHRLPSRFTIDLVRPQLRMALDRSIFANAQLIKDNRDRAIADTLQRFQGWATSIPSDGSDITGKRRETKAEIKKSLASLPFRERRVAIDQGHKFTAELSRIIADGSGAIAGIWHSHWRRPGYDYRIDHKDRDLKCYAIRGNWAMAAGLMKVGPAGYTDQISAASQEVNCTCRYEWLYNLRDLPPEMLAVKGREEMIRVRSAVAALR